MVEDWKVSEIIRPAFYMAIASLENSQKGMQKSEQRRKLKEESLELFFRLGWMHVVP